MPSESPIRKLVLLPGMDGTATLFGPLIARLPAHFEAIPIALPPDRALTYAELAEFAGARLPVSEPFALLAESFSTPLAIQIAAAHPACLNALILVAGFATNPSYSWTPRVASLLLPSRGRLRLPSFLIRRYLLGQGAPHSLVAAVNTAVSSLQPEVPASRLASIVQCDCRQQLAQVSIPILYLQAAQDRIVPPRCLEEIRAVKPETAVMRIDGPHLLLQREPQLCAEAIADFLRQLSAIPTL